MELMKAEVKDLTMLDRDIVIDGELAWNVAQLISDADDDVRLAKGKFWNRCKHGTREEICDHFGWNYNSMRRYSKYANAMDSISADRIGYPHFLRIEEGGVPLSATPEWLQRAADNGWTPKQLTRAVVDDRRQRVDDTIKSKKESGELPENATQESIVEDTKKSARERADEIGVKYREIPKTQEEKSTGMTMVEACEFLGLATLAWIAEDTLEFIYKGYAKQLHPDRNGNTGEGMQRLNAAHEILKTIIK
jgi:hypothetical protein